MVPEGKRHRIVRELTERVNCLGERQCSGFSILGLIKERRWLLVDFDKNGGRDQQHERVFQLSLRLIAYLFR